MKLICQKILTKLPRVAVILLVTTMFTIPTDLGIGVNFAFGSGSGSGGGGGGGEGGEYGDGGETTQSSFSKKSRFKKSSKRTKFGTKVRSIGLAKFLPDKKWRSLEKSFQEMDKAETEALDALKEIEKNRDLLVEFGLPYDDMVGDATVELGRAIQYANEAWDQFSAYRHKKNYTGLLKSMSVLGKNGRISKKDAQTVTDAWSSLNSFMDILK